MKLPPLPLLCVSLFALCAAVAGAWAGEPNTLTPEERADGWRLLFDGRTTAGWVAIGKDTFPASGWVVENGELVRKSTGGDLVTTETFDRFELMWEWKMDRVGGNSGVKYSLADPSKPFGFEYQMLGDEKRTGEKHESASLYDLIAPTLESVVHPAGQWNSSRLYFDGHRGEHWINGTKAVEYTLGTPEMNAILAACRNHKVEGFGKPTRSPILLQDHGGKVAFRSIKIRVLPPAVP